MVNPLMSNPKIKRETLILISVFVGVLIVSAFGVYFLAGKTNQSVANRESSLQSATQATPDVESVTRRPSPQEDREDGSSLAQIFGTEAQNQAGPRAVSWADLETVAFRLAPKVAVLVTDPQKPLPWDEHRGVRIVSRET